LVEEDGVYKLYTKGADTAIVPLLSPLVEHPFIEKTQKVLEDFSCVGLRTLVFAVRILSKRQFKAINKLYNEAIKSADKKAKLSQLCKMVERDLVLLGCSAVEDKLQDKVHSSITRFFQANIKVWMITGDKLQTAENIALSAGIFQPNMKIFSVGDTNKNNFASVIYELKKRIQATPDDQKKGIVVDISKASSLSSPAFIFGKSQSFSKDLAKAIRVFHELMMDADAVVCARSSPKQKAKLVRLVKSKGKTVLAIGDGANDVNMLTVIAGEQGSERGRRTLRRRRHPSSAGQRLCSGELQVPVETDIGAG
jgi:magnesium-transporting ATPase (P-type)